MRDVPPDFSEGLKKLNPGIKDEVIMDLWSKKRMEMRMQELQDTTKPKTVVNPANRPAEVPQSR
jgi:hypothetical protein